MEKHVKFLEFFRINRLLQYIVLCMVFPSIAFPAGALPDGLGRSLAKASVGGWQENPLCVLAHGGDTGLEFPSWQPNPFLVLAQRGLPEDSRTDFLTTPIRKKPPTQGNPFNVVNPIRAPGAPVRDALPTEENSSTDSGSTPPKAPQDKRLSNVEHIAITVNPMGNTDPSLEGALARKIKIRAKFPLILKAAAQKAVNDGNKKLGERLRLAAVKLAAKLKAEGEDETRRTQELQDLEKIPMTPGLKKVYRFMEEVFSQKATRTRMITNWATVLVVGGLCYSLRGIAGYFSDNISAVPNSSLSQYFQNEGEDIANRIALGIRIDWMPLTLYYVYSMKVLVDYVAGQFTMAPTGPKMQMSQKGILWAVGQGITYVATVGLAVLQGLGPANDTYQANAPFSNMAQYAQTAPVPLGIFMALNYFVVLIKPVEEKIISWLVNLYSDPDATTMRREDLETLALAKKKVYGMRGHELRDLYARLQPQGGQTLGGLQLLKALFQIVDEEDHTPQPSGLMRVVSEALEILAQVSRQQVQAPVHTTESKHVSTQKDFKPILKSMGIGLFWLLAMAVSVASAFLAFKKGSTGILNVDQRIKTGKPDLSFFAETVIGRGLRYQTDTWNSIPGLFNASMTGWDVYNELSNYTGNFSFNGWNPYTDLTVRVTDACSYCFSRADYGTDSAYISSSDPLGYYLTFSDTCPITPPIPSIGSFTLPIDPEVQLAYTKNNCYDLYNYEKSLYDNPLSLMPHLDDYVLGPERYFLETYLRGATGDESLVNYYQAIYLNGTASYTPTPAMKGFAETMGGLGAAASFAVGVFFFNKFFQYLQDSFAKDPTVPLPGKSNRLINGIVMPLAAAQALFWSADGFFLTWGILNDSSLTLKILVGGAVVATRFTIWFRTFDEAFGAMAGLIKQGYRNVYGKYHKWRNPAHKRPPISDEDMVDRLIKRISMVEAFYRKVDPQIMKEFRRAINLPAPPTPHVI